MVATNCLTGRAEYLEEKQSAARVMDIVRASSSLPYVTKITHVDGVPMLDGGIADSLPVEYALSQGYERLVVVLTNSSTANILSFSRRFRTEMQNTTWSWN